MSLTNNIDLWETIARHVWKVVMLIVVAHIECDQIQRPIVGVRLIALDKNVMLSNEVAGDGMQTKTKQCAEPQVTQRLDTKKII